VQETLPPCTADAPVTDVSEYSWLAPLACIWMSVLPGPALHHWVVASAAGSDIGKQAVHHSAKVLARSAVDLLADPDTLIRAREEHAKRLNGRVYECLVPADIQPPVDANREIMEKYRS
jgi:aminobenzoyl-glutamate utilization protein B